MELSWRRSGGERRLERIGVPYGNWSGGGVDRSGDWRKTPPLWVKGSGGGSVRSGYPHPLLWELELELELDSPISTPALHSTSTAFSISTPNLHYPSTPRIAIHTLDTLSNFHSHSNSYWEKGDGDWVKIGDWRLDSTILLQSPTPLQFPSSPISYFLSPISYLHLPQPSIWNQARVLARTILSTYLAPPISFLQSPICVSLSKTRYAG